MSSSLVRKSLLLDCSNDIDGTSTHKRPKNADGGVSEKQNNSRNVNKKVKRKQQKNGSHSKSKKNKTLEDDYKKYEEEDNTEHNLLMIAKMSGLETSQPEMVEKIVQHQKHRSRKINQEEKVSQQSVFSDRDFDQFAEEYDFDFWGK